MIADINHRDDARVNYGRGYQLKRLLRTTHIVLTRILIYEPDVSYCTVLQEHLEASQHWVVSSSDRETFRNLFSKQFFHLILLRCDKLEDLDVVQELKNTRPNSCVLVASRCTDTNFVVRAIRLGASNFWNHSELPELSSLLQETLSRLIPDEIDNGGNTDENFPEFIGRDPKIKEIFRVIQSIRNSDSTVLITGESGTGKEVVARAIHNVGARKGHPWVAVNCGAIPGNLLESELFGHVKGAFTGAVQNRLGRFQLANRGTLFLDEISDLTIDLQAKILRAIQNRVFEPVGSPQSLTLDARIIAATNRDLDAAVTEKRFREDLYYRLNVIPIVIPPLRSRKGDIPLLTKSFIEKFAKQNGKNFQGISEEAMRLLVQYHWPGNIRELENLMERVVVLKQDTGAIEMKDIPHKHFKNICVDRFIANVALPDEGLDFNDTVNEFENELILQALQKTAGNKNQAAGLLNLNRTTLVEKLKRKGLRLS